MIGRKVISMVAAMLAVTLSTAAPGQTIANLEIGQTKSGSAPSGVDLYRVGGTSGTELTLTLTGPGSSGLVLYTPDGEEMLTSEGTDVVRMTAILPLDDVFLVGVIRNERAPYSLKLDGVEPDIHFAEFAERVGYRYEWQKGVIETQCWVDPGRQIRITQSDGNVILSTIGRGGKTYYHVTNGSWSAKWEALRTVEGNEIVSTFIYANGRTDTLREPLDQEQPKADLKFVSYLCDGPRNASQSTPMPIPGPTSPAPVANVSTADGAAANAMAVVPSTPTSAFVPLGALDGQPALLFDVGPIATMAGRKFVDDTGTLEIYVDEGGRAFVLHFGRANGPRGAKLVFRAGGQPGRFPGEIVYDVGSKPTITGVLNANGSFLVLWDGMSSSEVYTVEGPNLIETRLVDGRFVVRDTYFPSTQSGLDLAQAGQAVREQSLQDQAQAKVDRERARQATAQNFMQGLQQIANASASTSAGSYAESQANLDAAVANIQYAAAAEHQQQHSSQQASQHPARTSQPQQVQVAASSSPSLTPDSDYIAGQNAASPSAEPAPGGPVQPESGAVPGKQLRFVLTISMRNLPGDKVNPTCYSNIISREGPPGWGSSGFLPPGSAEQAREAVYSLKSAFIAQCRASGREITSDGNFNFQLNQSQGDEERLQGMRARYNEDVSVSL